MTPRNLALVACLAVGCAHAPPPPLQPATRDHTRIVVVGEEGDEWLHEHCDYHGTAVVFDDVHAYMIAAAQHANFAELFFRYASSSSSSSVNDVTTTSSTSHHAIVLFACKENPPW